ncbi:MAG: type III-B CRISPR-associated protein Cas10/Cmr2 [Nannocystis sp.]|nr:type III-B CRISPR-associated protein Cas10/Cmr2 [Nannocystis sp.]
MQPTRYAVAIALGPVGRFISAGRRSRDLWYGSRLLSELTRKVAIYLKDEVGAELWTPREESLKDVFFDLKRKNGENGGTRQPPYQGPVISNKIRAIVPADTGEEIRERLATAEMKAREWLDGQLGEAAAKKLDPAIDLDAFSEQRTAILQGDFLEFYAGYARVEGVDEHKALSVAQELRDARKNTRLFVAPSWTRPGHSRSTMEPGRDSVQIHYPARTRYPKAIEAYKTRQRLGICSDERLDAIALLRRIAAMTQSQDEFQETKAKTLRCLPFPPLSRVAADPWIARVLASEAGRADLGGIRRILWQLEDENNPALHLISSPSREPGDCDQDNSARDPENKCFPYDASLLFEGSLEALEREVKETARNLESADTDTRTALEKLEQIEPHLRRLHQRFGAPDRYYVLLTADGDGIGSILQECETKGEEQILVKALDTFAHNAWNVVCDHHGVAFYVGGDELCAYLPVDRAPEAAKALADVFAKAMQQAAQALEKRSALAERTREGTLSVGLVVAHVKHDLRDIRERTEEALKAAKKARRKEEGAKRSWLRVIESTAGGVDRPCQGPTDDLVERINAWVELLIDGALSMGTAHGLLADLERYTADQDPRVGIELALGNLLLRRKRSGAAEAHPTAHKTLCERVQAIRALLEDPADNHGEHALREARGLAHEVILAQRIAAAKRLRPEEKSR